MFYLLHYWTRIAFIIYIEINCIQLLLLNNKWFHFYVQNKTIPAFVKSSYLKQTKANKLFILTIRIANKTRKDFRNAL